MIDATRDLIRRQIELEDESRALGQSRYHSRKLPWKVEAGAPEEEANLPPGKRLMKVAIPAVIEAVDQFLAEVCSGKAGRRHLAADFLLLTEPEEIAYLTLRVLVNQSIAGSLLQTAALRVTEAIIENLEFHAFREQNRVGYAGYLKKQAARGYSRQRRSAVKKLFASEGVMVEVASNEKVAIGTKCIELVVESTGLFTIEKVRRSRGHAYAVRPTETLQKWLDEEHARCSLLAPINLPMVIRPRRWRTPTFGGYLTRRPGNRFIKQRNRAYHEELANADIRPVYAAVNHIQDTPWRVNQRVLEVIDRVWTEGGTLGGLPVRHDEPLPEKPVDIETNEEAKAAWKREAAAVYQRNAERVSARMSLHQGLWVARKFAGEDRIFYPHELDFRGRVYPIALFGPSPQGSDWQKALIEFADAKPLGKDGLRWLMVHTANLFGVDKVSFADRIAWVQENAAALLDSGMNPLDGERFWTTADSPYCALAACMELADAMALADPSEYESRIPIALDGSCSGLQHFSAMLRDEAGGRAVNLVPSDKPQDIYSEVARRAQEEADATPTFTYVHPQTGEEVTMENPWMNGKVTRAIAKRPTMTFCYSATRFGMQGMIHQTLKELDREAERRGEPPHLGGADNYQASVWLSHVIYSSVRHTVRAAAEAMDWLRNAAAVAAEVDLPLWWTTPLGLPILQEYKKQEGKRVKAHWCGQRVDLMIEVDSQSINRRQQANGVAPNFVHSLDACHLQAVALRAREEGINHLAVIHDSFGTHAADTTRLAEILRETLVEQYQGNVLQDFYEELVEQLKGDIEDIEDRLPKPPVMGELDLKTILKSTYTFA